MDGMLNSEKWTDAEVKALLVLYATEEVQRNLGGSTKNIKIFGKISSELAQMGIYHTVKQCREKVKKLKQDYKKIKDHNNQSGANRKTSKWYATLDGILGHRPPYSGNAATKDSATGFLQTIVGSENTPPSDEILQEMWARHTVPWTVNEVQTFLSIMGEEEIQRELDGAARNKTVFQLVSRRMAAHGFHRTYEQCRIKSKKLRSDYRRIRDLNSQRGVNRKSWRWFDMMDAIYGHRQASIGREGGIDSATALLESMVQAHDSTTTTNIPVSYNITFIPCPPPAQTPCPTEDSQDPGSYSMQVEDVGIPCKSTTVTLSALEMSDKDRPLHFWSSEEVQALLTLWGNPAVQEELLLNMRNNKVYTSLSTKLASLGFNKSPQKCREKIKKLKQEYKRIKSSQHNSSRRSVWFAIMDDILSSTAAAARWSETAEPSLLSQSQSALDVDTDDDTQWLPDEVQVLMTLWAQPNIQKQLLNTATNNKVFVYLSSELTFVGFNKTPHQCRLKVNNLKEEYRRIKELEPYRDVRNDWFAILDGVLGPGGETSTEVDSSAALTQPNSPEVEHVNDMSRAVWTSDEIKVLLTRWAEESIQEQLRSTPRNERVFAQLSSELATQGFDKTTSQCRSKIKLLKRKYRKTKEQKESKKPKSRWFAIMDKVLGRCKPVSEIEQEAEVMDSAPTFLQTSQQDLSETVEDLGCRLSVSSLCLLVPTLRLMCAFAWRVIQCCNVLHYGKVEELVRLVTELAPELLTPRERVQLLLRLRARMVLDLCRSESTANLLYIQPHLTVIQNLTTGSTCDQEELENSKSNFVDVVHTLLEDTEKRNMFFKEVFHIHYGQQYEATLQTLVWKFISKLDNLLPVPDIKQTAEWLSAAPSVMEECGQLVLEPEQLKALLHFHQHQSGSTNKRYSQTQNMFLPRLSLPHEPNSRQLASEQQASSTGDTDDGQSDYSEENQSDDELALEDRSKGDEVLKLKEEPSDDLTAVNCSNLNNHTPLGLHTCSLCPYSDSQVSGLLQHIRKAHLSQEPSRLQSKEPRTANGLQKVDTETCTPETMPLHCDKCEKTYSSRASLNVHRRIHTGETPYLCSHCGRGFRTSSGLDFHVRIHTGDRRYKCPICGKTSIQHMMRHMRMHRGEKNFLCTECGKAFLTSGELKLHMRSHTGERPYTCKDCGKGFTAKCLLTVHMRRHTGERPYRCSVCPKSFKTSRMRKRHMMIHSNNKSFQCLKCGKIFRHEDTFNMHVQTHN
ncbi:uncharacterized protein LOC116060041 isoform X4 [Sander lucioperca]|uniref:uncharacterized protein LOC116060041 isoform X4 n=1 Tax=Sander lucioperca TaxID=283035 RepID=UPI00125D7B1D|nr:uncharacterized protein LOC116060041 isoform X4 [Sander lucioperca]